MATTFAILFASIFSLCTLAFFVFRYFKLRNEIASLKSTLDNEGKLTTKSIHHPILLDIANSIQSINQLNKLMAKGDYSTQISAESQNNSMWSSYANTYNTLKSFNEKEKLRTWLIESLNLFNEKLRKKIHEKESFYQDLLSFLVRQTGSLQGGIFLADENESTLDMLACFAYNRERFLQNKLVITGNISSYRTGEGLIGQVYMEKEALLLEHAPKGYLSISGGLGLCDLQSLAIFPIKDNDNCVGALELACEGLPSEEKLEFIEKALSLLATHISSEKLHSKTQKLLQHALENEKQLQVQEEELRQSVEELLSTQEQMNKNQEELIYLRNSLEKEVERQTLQLKFEKEQATKKEAQLQAILNGLEEGIFAADEENNIVLCNEAFKEMIGLPGTELTGKSYSNFLTIEKLRYRKIIQGVLIDANGNHAKADLTVNRFGFDGMKVNLFCIKNLENIFKSLHQTVKVA